MLDSHAPTSIIVPGWKVPAQVQHHKSVPCIDVLRLSGIQIGWRKNLYEKFFDDHGVIIFFRSVDAFFAELVYSKLINFVKNQPKLCQI